MIRMICDIVEWLYNSWIRKVLLLNGHMWNWGSIYSARENIHYDLPDIQVRVLDWWSTTSTISSLSLKDCPALTSYVHANIWETSCMLAISPDFKNGRSSW
jgi:creatinine amidohydrolase